MRERSTAITPGRYYRPRALADLRRRLHLIDAVPADVAEVATRPDTTTGPRGAGAYGLNILSRLSARGWWGFEVRS